MELIFIFCFAIVCEVLGFFLLLPTSKEHQGGYNLGAFFCLTCAAGPVFLFPPVGIFVAIVNLTIFIFALFYQRKFYKRQKAEDQNTGAAN